MSLAYDADALVAYLAETDAELELYIDDAHMSYLPIYLGRADARHALGEGVSAPDVVLAEIARAARVYKGNGTVILAKLPPEAFRRRRLEPLEVAILCGDIDLAKAVAKVFAIDPMTLFAGIEPDDVSAEIHALTPYFKTERIGDVVDLAGALACFYWLALGVVASEDGEGWEVVRRRAARVYDDYGQLAGGAASGGVARIRTIQEALAALRPARPDVVVSRVLRHQKLVEAEHIKAADNDPQIQRRGTGALDRTALALLGLASALRVDCGAELVLQGADPATLAYARRLGHTAQA